MLYQCDRMGLKFEPHHLASEHSFSYFAVLLARRYASVGISRHHVSVCPSATRRYCTKTAKRRITQTTPRDSSGTLVFNLSDANSRWWATPQSPWNLCLKLPTPPRTQRLRPISVHSASTVRASKNIQLALIESLPCAFQRAIDEPCTLPLSPPKGGTKRDFAVLCQ